jgi:alpha-L-arabinofuranosidase
VNPNSPSETVAAAVRRRQVWAVCLGILWLGAMGTAPAAGVVNLTVETAQRGARINPAMWGIFFEDINLGADGGLYAELIKNRSFEFPEPLMGWIKLTPSKAQGTITVRNDDPFNDQNPRYVRIESRTKDLIGIANEGFRGIGIKQGETYHFTAQARRIRGEVKLRVELYRGDGAVLDSVKVTPESGSWHGVSATLKPRSTEARAKLYVIVEGPGAVDLDFISLFPAQTWKGRPGGLRADMVQLLADLKPGFMRFPGGCIVEGIYLTNRYQWKKTLGPLVERETMLNRWNVEFLHRPTPDYFQSFGLGFFEFFQLCEDIGAEPLPILSCGLACQFNSGEACPLDQLDPYIQDAVDLIEFANGATNTTWGAKRAAMGHPAPFQLKMIGIGNENWQQPYLERYAKFHAVLKARHPEIQLVSSAGPGPDGHHFDYAWPKLRELKADIVDEHCYARPDWFFDHTRRYDHYDRQGPKVFFGEYAAQSDKVVSVKNRNNLQCAIAEAAFMTGLERNAEVVRMASYAPLFAHIDGWQWTPNLIWVDNLRSYGTPSYYVQKLFANHRGDVGLPVRLENADQLRIYATAALDEGRSEIIVKLVNGETAPVGVRLNLSGPARLLRLAGADRAAENSFVEPEKIAPLESAVELSADEPLPLPANSLTILRVSAK